MYVTVSLFTQIDAISFKIGGQAIGAASFRLACTRNNPGVEFQAHHHLSQYRDISLIFRRTIVHESAYMSCCAELENKNRSAYECITFQRKPPFLTRKHNELHSIHSSTCISRLSPPFCLFWPAPWSHNAEKEVGDPKPCGQIAQHQELVQTSRYPC